MKAVGALSCMERDLTLPNLISCATQAETDMVKMSDRPDLGVHNERLLMRGHRGTHLERSW